MDQGMLAESSCPAASGEPVRPSSLPGRSWPPNGRTTSIETAAAKGELVQKFDPDNRIDIQDKLVVLERMKDL